MTHANPLLQVRELGQSLWYDYITRQLIDSGELKRLIDEDGLGGMTSNPSIFQKAFVEADEYAEDIAKLLAADENDPTVLYERLAVSDIRSAADVMRPVFDRTGGADGFVSLEVSPVLSADVEATLAEARRLWTEVDRPNLMVKVPATPECIPAIRTLIAEGININITLLFSPTVYEQVAEAYISGLEERAERGEDIAGLASVASFFVSRIDTLVDDRLDDCDDSERAQALKGKVAIANAKLTYARFKKIFAGARWAALAERGARPQRLLWASTSTKNPDYRDVLYVEELIGPDTVDTVPPETFDAFRDHGIAETRLERGLDEAQATMDSLAELGISFDEVTGQLLKEGVEKFRDAFEGLLETVAKSCAPATA